MTENLSPIANINDPDFPYSDFENEFCSRLDKIQGIADLFFCALADENRELISAGVTGISLILSDCVKELRTICYKMLDLRGVSNENRKLKAKLEGLEKVIEGNS